MATDPASARFGLVPYREGQRCWVLTDRNGDDWHEEAVAHYDTEAEADAYLAECRKEADDPVVDRYGPRASRQLGTECLILYCADPECGEEYDGDEFRHVHWPADDPSLVRMCAEDADWKVGVDGQLYCPETIGPVDHTPVMEDGECSECGFAESDHRFPHDPSEVTVIP